MELDRNYDAARDRLDLVKGRRGFIFCSTSRVSLFISNLSAFSIILPVHVTQYLSKALNEKPLLSPNNSVQVFTRMPPERIHRAQRVRGVGPLNRSRRNVRGAGWHRRGYRDHGDMWINVKEGSYGAVHGMDVNENETLAGFVKWVACEFTSYCH